MKLSTEILIASLLEHTWQHIKYAEALQLYNDNDLNWRASAESWSILECIEHLNLYGDHYIPEMTKAIQFSNSSGIKEYKSGLLGNYFANSMLPGKKMRKMKTFKDKNPLHFKLNRSVIDRFIKQEKELIDLLNSAVNVDINTIKIKTSISVFLRLRLGDTFRFVVNHTIRHIGQINKIEDALLKKH